jgi:tetratricopeptide (TPR) repeat protein
MPRDGKPSCPPLVNLDLHTYRTARPAMKAIRLPLALIALAMATQGGLAVAQTARDLLQQGNRALQEFRFMEAEAAFRQAISLDPKNADLYKNLGNVLTEQIKYEEAEVEYRKAITLDPKNVDLYNDLGNVLTKQRRYEEAEVEYRKVIALDPKNVVAYKRLAFMLRGMKKYPAAEAAFRQAFALDPKDALVSSNFARLLSDQKKYLEAESVYRQAIALDPKDERLYGYLGGLLNDQKNYVGAEEVFRQAMAVNPKSELNYNNYLDLADVLKLQEKYSEAEEVIREAISVMPKESVYYVILGDLLIRDQKRHVEAEELYRKAIALGGNCTVLDNCSSFSSLSTLLSDQKRYAEVEAMYRQAIAKHQGVPEILTMFGYWLSGQGRYAEAEIEYRQAIAIDPKDGSAYSNLAAVLLKQNRQAEAEGVYRQAVAVYKQAIASDPMKAHNYNNIGYIFQKLNRLTEARDYYHKAVALDPDSESFRANLEQVERLIGIAGGTLKPLSPAESTRFLDPQDPLTPVRRSVVRILPTFSANSSGYGAWGTGFVVRRQGGKALILTARHVIREPEGLREAVNIQVELYGGNLPPGIVETQLQAQEAKSGEDDLALLVVVGLPEDIQPLNFASLPVKDGMPLTMVGHPRQEKWKNITGTLLTSNLNTLLVNSSQMSAQRAVGVSGSPVLSDKAEVIGMVYQQQNAGDIEQLVAYSLAKLQATMRQWGQ